MSGHAAARDLHHALERVQSRHCPSAASRPRIESNNMEAKAKPADSALEQHFERLYYAEVDPEELAARAPRDLKGAAAAHLEFGRRFTRGKPKIRAYNPLPAQHGWHSTHTVIEIVNDDMPFLVDSVAMEVNRQGLTLHLVVHPVLRTVRNRAGELVSAAAPVDSSQGELESFMHVEVDRQTDPAMLAELEAGIARILADVRARVGVEGMFYAGNHGYLNHQFPVHQDAAPGPELGTEMTAALASISEELREALVLVEIGGLTCREAAETLGIPEGAVKSRLFHARKRLLAWFSAGSADDRGERAHDG
jgi:predicted DNA-binding protein (UPF0251 family)